MKKFLSKKALAIIALVLVVGVGGYFVHKKYASKNSTKSSTKYSLSKVTKTNLDITVEATGTVTGADAVNVYSSNTGAIQGMTAKLGGAVNKGDLFCKIDDDTNQQAVENAKISLQHSYLELQSLKNQLDDLTIKAPIDGKVRAVYAAAGDDIASIKSTYGGMAMITVGDGSLETAVPFPSSGKVAEVNVSAGQTVKKGDVLFKLDPKTLNNSIAQKENDIKLAEKNLADKEETLSKSTISTPISGIVTTLSVKNGEIVTNEKLIATITDTAKMQVTLAVDELDINKVQIGQTTTVKIDDIENKTFTGIVESIAQSGTTTNNVTTYDVIVTINNPENVKIGMNANVTIAVQSKANVLTVPVEAIVEKNGKKYVMVQDTQKSPSSSSSSKKDSNNTTPGKLVEVKTGLKNKTLIEITSGVTEGQTVMTELSESTSTSTKSSSKSKSSQQSGGMGGGMGGPPGM
ncbi:efflux RND transporter periplasmic adaptor subunit [Clostridium thailandense]|uniref:HlyD family efflux transporter periplasmic adaptor subunit n=1 Tax=Clostridium thailandense TaxID=2794346 RepID=A0A949TWB7_9CLOT|nr:HlyD family efflux transporter periplasmic adaptor subunit [Clostridium thailandense]MBV7274766.1 HlyD family efflux transporter periplasmic adaptor subunit [Clostridium thailandense]MCH5137227.1 HlyD family efflux transporter periplasmic adaptor subunit [Clostridiaceae bacterium UIB06]